MAVSNWRVDFAAHHLDLTLDPLDRALDSLAVGELDLRAPLRGSRRPQRRDFLRGRVVGPSGNPRPVRSSRPDRLASERVEALHQRAQVPELDGLLRVDPEGPQKLLRTVPLCRRGVVTVVGVVAVTTRSFV